MRSVSLLVVSEFSLRVGFSILIGLVITAAFALAMWEYLGRSKRGGDYPVSNVKLSLSALGPNILTFAFIAPWWALVYLKVPDLTSLSIPISGVSLLAAFIACDLSYYIEHRCGHKIKILWRKQFRP